MQNQFSDFYFSSYGHLYTPIFDAIFTITRKIKILKLIFHSVQHTRHLSCKDGHFWGSGGRGLHILTWDRTKIMIFFWMKSENLILKKPTYKSLMRTTGVRIARGCRYGKTQRVFLRIIMIHDVNHCILRTHGQGYVMGLFQGYLWITSLGYSQLHSQPAE